MKEPSMSPPEVVYKDEARITPDIVVVVFSPSRTNPILRVLEEDFDRPLSAADKELLRL